MEKQIERQCRANAVFTDEAYLKTRYICREDGTYTIRVGRGERRDVLACKELYGKAVKTALELDCTACAFRPRPRVRAWAERPFCCGRGRLRRRVPEKIRAVWPLGAGAGVQLSRRGRGRRAGAERHGSWRESIMGTRDLVNCPANLLRPEMLAHQAEGHVRDGLPVEAELL